VKLIAMSWHQEQHKELERKLMMMTTGRKSPICAPRKNHGPAQPIGG
jgi:hypothetical protein